MLYGIILVPHFFVAVFMLALEFRTFLVFPFFKKKLKDSAEIELLAKMKSRSSKLLIGILIYLAITGFYMIVASFSEDSVKLFSGSNLQRDILIVKNSDSIYFLIVHFVHSAFVIPFIIGYLIMDVILFSSLRKNFKSQEAVSFIESIDKLTMKLMIVVISIAIISGVLSGVSYYTSNLPNEVGENLFLLEKEGVSYLLFFAKITFASILLLFLSISIFLKLKLKHTIFSSIRRRLHLASLLLAFIVMLSVKMMGTGLFH